MALESEYFPEHSSAPAEDRRAYKRIVYGFFAFYAVAVLSVAGAAIAGTNFQGAVLIVAAALN
jgi:elongation factor P hydroxylase